MSLNNDRPFSERVSFSGPRWAIFISGTGSNFRALMQNPGINIALVVSSKATAVGLKTAARAGIPSLVLDKKVDWDLLTLRLQEYGIQNIFLAGFMKIVPEEFVKIWEPKIVNVHPSLLPLYPGLKSIERSIEEKNDVGVTVHLVNEKVDDGEILLQKSVVRKKDWASFNQDEPDVKSLNEEIEIGVHRIEHRLVQKAAVRFSFKKMVDSLWE